MSNEIINKVAQSGLLSLDLADFYDRGERVVIDLKDRLFMGQILREKDLRDWAQSHDWSQYSGKNVLLTCSADAVIPGWSWMLLVTYLQPFCKTIVQGIQDDLEKELFRKALDKIDFSQFKDKKVVVKGCGDIEISPAVYADLTARLMPFASKIMYGEPCSTVPLFKRK